MLVNIEGLSAPTLAEPLLLGVKPRSKATLTNTTIIFSLEFQRSRTHSIAGCRSSNKIMIYSIVANDNGQSNVNPLILLILLPADTYNKLMHSSGFMHFFFFLIVIVI